MSSSKIFIAVLFLIGIFFVVGINLGAARSDDLTFQTPDWVKGLGRALASPQPLKSADLNPELASCLQQGRLVVPAEGACTFAIKQSTFTSRVVMLQLVQGASAMVTLTQEGILPMQQSFTKVDNTTTADLKVYPNKAHAMLDIKCLDAGKVSPCLFQLM
jgi:hypothetical protein